MTGLARQYGTLFALVAIIVVFGTAAIYLFKISRPWLIYRL